MENTHSFYATLTANVFVSDDDFDFIYQCFQRHYDTTIKMAADVGGFLYGFKNRRTKFYPEEEINDEYNRTIELSNRQIQLVLKSMEMQSSEQASAINLRFHKIISELIFAQNHLNENSREWKMSILDVITEMPLTPNRDTNDTNIRI